MSHLRAIARGITLVALSLVVTFIGPGMAGAWDEPTLAKGYVSRNSAINGVILFLHGCDGGSNTSPFVDWYDWFERSGFKVYAPNSFAEPRPPMSCSTPYPNKDEIYAVRVKQTVRVLDQLMQEYSHTRIYVWGHSEGGGVANTLEQKVAGILTTGYPCGFKRTPTTRIRPDVPVLVLMGSERLDHYLLEAHLASGYATLHDLCADVFRSHPNASWKQFYTLGHGPYPGHLELFRAVNEFLGIKTPW